MYESLNGSMYGARLRYQNSSKNAYNYNQLIRTTTKQDRIAKEVIEFVINGTPITAELASDKDKTSATLALQSIAGTKQLEEDRALARFRVINSVIRPGVTDEIINNTPIRNRKQTDTYVPLKPRKPVVKDVRFTQNASCSKIDTDQPERLDVYFDQTPLNIILAKSICRLCPVQRECLDYALTNSETYGVWGGATENERRKIKNGKLGVDDVLGMTSQVVIDSPPVDAESA